MGTCWATGAWAAAPAAWADGTWADLGSASPVPTLKILHATAIYAPVLTARGSE